MSTVTQEKQTLYPTTYPDEQEFWTGEKLFSFLGDCDVVMTSSIRNLGKTYAMFQHLRNHLEQGHNVCVSRYDRVELGVSVQDFLRYYEETDPETGEITRHYTKLFAHVRDTPYQCYQMENGARVYFFAVKDSPNLKGLEIPNLWRWYIDEFVPLTYKVQTRKYNEFDHFRELYHTLVRTNTHLKVLMSANVKKWMNPYYMGWGIPKFESGNILKITRGGLKLAVENVKPSQKMAERFVKAERTMGTDEDDIQRMLHDYDNDPDCFIDPCENGSDIGVQVKIKGNIYGIYSKNGRMYFTKEKLNTNKDRYLLTPIEYEENFVYSPVVVNTIEKNLEVNNCRFENRECEFHIRLGIWLSHTKKV